MRVEPLQFSMRYESVRILYLSQYFPPEVGATQTRAYEMARRGELVTPSHCGMTRSQNLTADRSYPSSDFRPQKISMRVLRVMPKNRSRARMVMQLATKPCVHACPTPAAPGRQWNLL